MSAALVFAASAALAISYTHRPTKQSPSNSNTDEGVVRRIHDGDEFSNSTNLSVGDLVIIASVHDLKTRSTRPVGSQLALYQLEEVMRVSMQHLDTIPVDQVVEQISESVVTFLDAADNKGIEKIVEDDLVEQQKLVSLITRNVGSSSSSNNNQTCLFVSSFSLNNVKVGKSITVNGSKLRSVTNPSPPENGALKDFMYMPM